MPALKKIFKLILKNPLTEYLFFIVNWTINKFKYKRLSQEYLSFIYKSTLDPNVKIYERAIIKGSDIGSFSYIGDNSHVNRASIGKFCCIGPNCTIGTGCHPSSTYVSIHPIFFSTSMQVGITFSDKDYFKELDRVIIGNDVWIGVNAIIMDGITIGDGAIIGSGAIVTRDVPPYAIVGGVPAKIIRNRFEGEVVDFLLKFKWWEKDAKWLKDNFKKFHNFEIFIENFREDIKISD